MRVARRIGLLGSWKSRFPSTDASYSSLDTVTWSTARALRRRGAEVVLGGAEIGRGNDGIELDDNTWKALATTARSLEVPVDAD